MSYRYTDEEWSRAEYEDISDGTCDVCGEVHPIRKTTDPFDDEGIFGDGPTGEEQNWCYSCWLNRKEDV